MQNKLYEILMNDDVMTSIKQNEEELFSIIPELKSMVNFPHNHPHHCYDVWEHTLHALSYASLDFKVRLTLLLHDISKPTCYQDGEDGVRHFHGHNEASGKMCKIILERLGYEENFVNEITYLVSGHDSKITQEEINDNKELQRLRLEVQKCDLLAHEPKYISNKFSYFEEMEELLQKSTSKK